MMRSTKLSWAALGALSLLAFVGCASGPLDESDSAHVVLQIETLDTDSRYLLTTPVSIVPGSITCDEQRTIDRSLDVFNGGFNAAHGPQMSVGMDSLSSAGSAEEFGDLRKTVLIGLFRKGQILAIGLALAGKCVLKILLC